MLSFKDFLNEASLVTGKIDLSTLSQLVKLAAQYAINHPELKKDPEMMKFESILFYRVELWGKSIDVAFSNYEDSIASAEKENKNKYLLRFTKRILEFDDFNAEIIISHEFSHILDKGMYSEKNPITRYKGRAVRREERFGEIADLFFQNPLFRKKQFKAKTIEGKLKLVEDYMREIINAESPHDHPKFLPWYMKKDTEVEAHVGMIDYAVNLLLQKNPEKAEALKVLLRKGDMNLKQVFPELASSDKFMERMMKFEKIKKKLQKRLVVTLSSTEAAKEKLEIQLAGRFEFKNGKINVPDGEKFLEEYKKIVS